MQFAVDSSVRDIQRIRTGFPQTGNLAGKADSAAHLSRLKFLLLRLLRRAAARCFLAMVVAEFSSGDSNVIPVAARTRLPRHHG